MTPRCAVLAGLLALAGCAVGPDYHAPELAVPKQWSEAAPSSGHGQQTPVAWWRTFNDPVLDQLVADAVAANLSLQQAELAVHEARVLRAATIAAGLPELASRSALSRRRNNNSAAFPQSGQTSTTPSGFGVGNQVVNIFQLGFDAQWELDFFGGVRRAVEAADAAIDVQEENRRALLVTLLGEVARTYIELRTQQRQLAIAESTLRAQQDIVEMVRARQKGGLASTLEVVQAEGQAAAVRAQLPTYKALAQHSVHALGVLLGKDPGALAARLGQPGPVPAAAFPATTELPSTLLQRRPDIRRAERQLAAANAEVGIAMADLYPKVNLAAFLGLQNINITDLTPLGKSWSMAATLTMPIFNWGKLQAIVKSKEARYGQTLLSYRETVLNAFKDVEDALSAHQQEQLRRAALADAVAADRVALTLAETRYLNGLSSFIDVLISQQALFKAESDLADSEATVSNSLVALYKAMGGGWENPS